MTAAETPSPSPANRPVAGNPLSLVHDVDSHVSVEHGGVELFRYVYRPDDVQLESPKPYFHPIRTPDGHVASLFRPHDHVWHKGIAWSLPNVGDDNFWGGATYRRDRGYEQTDNNGSMDHVGVREASVDGDTAVFEHDLEWRTQGGSAIIAERRRITAHAGRVEGAWVLGFATQMTNISGEAIAIGSPTTEGRENAGYGGLFWRGPRSFTGGVLLSPDGPGGEELRGRRYPWLGFTGTHDDDGASSSIIFVDAGENPRHPPQWFARSEPFGCVNPAPFFSEEYELAAGESVAFRYAVVIADGTADQDRCAELVEAAGVALG